MTKLVFKRVVVEEVFYSLCNNGLLQYLVDVYPSAHVDHEELTNKSLNFSRKVSWECRILASNYLHAQKMHGTALKRRSECA